MARGSASGLVINTEVKLSLRVIIAKTCVAEREMVNVTDPKNIPALCFNSDKIYHPEGLFLKTYKHSAFLLSVNVKAFKPSKRVFKSLGEEVVCVGFTKGSFEKYMKDFEFVVGMGGEYICDSPNRFDFAAFVTWKNQLLLKSDVPKPS